MAKVLTNLIFKGSTLILDDEADFPSSPEFGQFCFKSGVLYIFATIDTLETWYPLTNKNSHFVFTQALTSTSWVIAHNLQSEDLIFMAYDENDVQMIPSDVTFDSENQITLSYTEAVKGRAVVFGATETYTPAITTASLSVGSDISMSGTSITVSGTDIVALLDQTQSDLNAMFSWNNSLGEITFKGDLIPENNDALSIGSATKKVKDVYIAAATLHVGDNATFEGTSLAIDAGVNPTSLGDTPTVQASSLILKPFTYNPGAGDINVEPVLKFQNLGGQQYGISFNLLDNEFQLDSPSGVGTGSLNVQNVTASKVTADTIETTGTEQVKFDQGLRVDGDVSLGYDDNNTVIIRGAVDLQTPITFSEAATLGDGNDTIAINCGAANNFTVVSQHMSINASGKVTAAEMESAGNMTIQGDLFVNGTQTVVDTTTLQVTDNEVVVNNGEAGAGITAGSGGVRIDRGSLPDALFIFDDADDKWKFGTDGSLSEFSIENHDHDSDYLRTDADSEPVTDNVHEIGTALKRFSNIFSTTFTGDLTGNADTTTALETSRSINLSGDASGSASFDGTGDANISVTVADDSHAHDNSYHTKLISDNRYARRDADTTPSNDNVHKFGDATHRWSEVHAVSFKGNVDTADKLFNSRDINLTGDVTGTVAFDGSGNVNLAATVVDGSHHHNTQYYTQAECNTNFVTVAGDTLEGNINFNTYKANFGSDSNDMFLWHSGTTGYIVSQTGELHIQTNTSEKAIIIKPNAEVELYHDNTLRAKTTSLGLEVNGVFQGQATEATYADLAEVLTCAEEFVYPGTVMKACETGEFDVEECATEFAKNIIGVVSENPAYLMNKDESGIVVAYTGKVRVRVKGPVGKGQPIVPAGEGIARGLRKDPELLYSFGTTLEANESSDEKMLWCIVK